METIATRIEAAAGGSEAATAGPANASSPATAGRPDSTGTAIHESDKRPSNELGDIREQLARLASARSRGASGAAPADADRLPQSPSEQAAARNAGTAAHNGIEVLAKEQDANAGGLSRLRRELAETGSRGTHVLSAPGEGAPATTDEAPGRREDSAVNDAVRWAGSLAAVLPEVAEISTQGQGGPPDPTALVQPPWRQADIVSQLSSAGMGPSAGLAQVQGLLSDAPTRNNQVEQIKIARDQLTEQKRTNQFLEKSASGQPAVFGP